MGSVSAAPLAATKQGGALPKKMGDFLNFDGSKGVDAREVAHTSVLH